jgi:hypothetical protein
MPPTKKLKKSKMHFFFARLENGQISFKFEDFCEFGVAENFVQRHKNVYGITKVGISQKFKIFFRILRFPNVKNVRKKSPNLKFTLFFTEIFKFQAIYVVFSIENWICFLHYFCG